MTASSITSRHQAGAEPSLWSRRFLAVAVMEFWERFAMYGVKSLLVLILLDRIVTGDLAHVAGAASLRRAIVAVFGPVSTTGLASQIYGGAIALVYLAIPLGGLAGDALRNRRQTVLAGGAGMVAGLAMMLADGSFLIGLGVFAIGTGLLKGNLSVQVGELFQNGAQRQRGYTVYLGFLNGGVICGPLACGALAAWRGAGAAILLAGLAMVLGLALYVRSSVPPTGAAPSPDHRPRGAARVTGGLAGGLLILAVLAVYLCFAAYEQLGNIVLVWARGHVDLSLAGLDMPVAWFLSLDGLFTLVLIILWQMVLRRQARRGIRIGAVLQICIGCLLCAAGYGVLALASTGAGPVSLLWPLVYLVLVDSAIVLVWPSGLTLIAEVAPRRLVGFWTGLFYLHGFFAHLIVGMVGMWYERMAAPAFWLLHAAMAGSGALLILIAGIPLALAIRARQAITTSAWAKAAA